MPIVKAIVNGVEQLFKFADDMPIDEIRTALQKKLAPVAAGAGLLGTEEEAEASFIGQLAKTFDKGALALAKKMAKAGKSRDEIWKATGDMGKPTYKDVDGHWKQEIDDSGSEIFPQTIKNYGYIKQKELYENTELYKAYPDIGDIYTNDIGRTKGADYNGMYNPSKDTIELRLHDRKNKDIASTNQHEIQHAIQEREGFALGSNVEYSQKILQDADTSKGAINDYLKIEKENYNELLSELGHPEAKEMYDTAWKMKEADRLQGYLDQYHRGGKLTDKRRLILGSGGSMNDVNFEHRMRMGINWSKRHRPQAEKDAQYAEYIEKSLQQVYKDLDPKRVEKIRGLGVKDPAKKIERQLDNIRNKVQSKHGGNVDKLRKAQSEFSAFLEPYVKSFRGDHKLYMNTAGEVEARTVQERLDMGMGERIDSPPWKGDTWKNSPESKRLVRTNEAGYKLPISEGAQKFANAAKYGGIGSLLAGGSTSFADTMNTMSNEIPNRESKLRPENQVKDQDPKTFTESTDDFIADGLAALGLNKHRTADNAEMLNMIAGFNPLLGSAQLGSDVGYYTRKAQDYLDNNYLFSNPLFDIQED